MIKVFIYFLCIIFVSGQSRKDIFHEVKKSEKKVVMNSSPDLMFDIGMGYLFHENNRFVGSTYSNGPSINLDIKKYFFKGSYLNLSITYSNTEFGREVAYGESRDSIVTNTLNYAYLSYYLGIDYFFNSKDFTSPWFFGFGFGSNNFIASTDNFNRFSVQIRFGKITNINFLTGKLAFDISALLFEDRGIQYRRDINFGYTQAYTDWILFTSLKLGMSLNYDVSNLF